MCARLLNIDNEIRYKLCLLFTFHRIQPFVLNQNLRKKKLNCCFGYREMKNTHFELNFDLDKYKFTKINRIIDYNNERPSNWINKCGNINGPNQFRRSNESLNLKRIIKTTKIRFKWIWISLHTAMRWAYLQFIMSLDILFFSLFFFKKRKIYF